MNYNAIIFGCFSVIVINSLQFNQVEMSMRLATKTPYISNGNFINTKFDGFDPIKLWGIIRHGTRIPNKKSIMKYKDLVNFRDNLVVNSTQLSDGQREAFKNWSPKDIDLKHAKHLTVEGERELFGLGTRIVKSLPQLTSALNTVMTFKHTPTQRTKLSAEKFIEGMFPENSNKFESVEVAKDDPILRPYKGCPLWRKNVKKNKSSLIEKMKFHESFHVENLVNELRSLTNDLNLNIQQIESIYVLCAFETAWEHQLYNDRSVWCSLFNENQLKVLEYLKDLEYFYIDGPGFEITRKVACQTVLDMLTRLDPENDENFFSFYFTHSGTMLKFVTFLEMFKDESPITAENFNDNRKWKTSLIDKFASNFFAVLYKQNETNEHFIQFHYQENLVEIPNCVNNQHGMCRFEDFKKFYMQKIENCNLTKICQENDEL